MSFFQGGETLFPILVVSVGHGDGTGGKVGPHRKGLLVNGTTTISAKRGSSMGYMPNRGVGKGLGPRKKKLLKNDRYDCDQGEERNPMG
jgi:hypothetical protein